MFVHLSRMTPAFLGLAVMLASATTGRAADLDFTPPPELRPSVFNWSGAYAGGLFTGGFLDSFYTPSTGPDPELAGDGVMGGVVAGYNFQFDHVVFGVEADGSLGAINAKNSLDQVDFEVEGIATARARLGYAFDDTLIYTTAGIGAMAGRMFLPAFDETDRKIHYGFVLGGGIEHAFSDYVRGRLEYIHGDFENKVYEFNSGTVDQEINDLHLIRAAMVWNFNAED